jgi:hypothetical protein
MKTRKLLRLLGLLLISTVPAWFATNASALDTNAIRLAIGPFFAPVGNTTLEKAATDLPDLLMVSLSHESRFQLVEREKINAIWSELHLAEAGLTSADTVGKLGRILSCDWLVSGSFVQTGSGTQIWVKVINTQDSVVLDLQAVPHNGTNFSATADAVAKFLAQTGSRSRPHEFIALGKFEDKTVSATREDWSPRLAALIEKHFLAAGYGIVEREAMGPIFAEYQLQTAGLTGDSTNRVKLKPAFWIVDGGCKWIYDTQDKLSVAIRIQKMGGGEQVFSFTQPPGDALEKAVVDAIQSALTNANPMTLEQVQKEEGKIRSAHVGELVKGRGETMPPLRYSTNQTFITVTDAYGGKRQMLVDPTFLAQRESHAHEMLKTLQQAILLNPKDMHSKWALGMSLYCMADPVKKQHGQELLEEVAASDDVTNATKAKNWLADFKSGRLTLEPDRLGNLAIVTHGQPASVPAVTNQQALANNMAARMAKLNEITNVVERAEGLVQIPPPQSTGYFESIGAIKMWRGKFYIASGTTLQCYEPATESTVNVNLPLKLAHPITAIEADDKDLWLGTDGGGLVRIPQSGGTAREFGEKDGFPMPSLTALLLIQGRLLIGFGFQRSGAFGYLDTATEKFTGVMAEASIHKSRQEAVQNPPETSISSITTKEGTNILVASGIGLQRFDLASRKWTLAVPEDLADIRGVSDNSMPTNSRFLAAQVPTRCVAICKLPGTQWTCVNISTDLTEDSAMSISTDQSNPNWLWIGGFHGKVTLLDMATSKIIGECNLPSHGVVRWIFDGPDNIIFIAMSKYSETYDLYCLKKPALSGTRPNAAPVREQTAIERQLEVLQKNFAKFVPVQFRKEANGEAAIQRLHVRDNMFKYRDKYYCGFKFTVPAWLDGDFEWMYVLAKTEAEKDFNTPTLSALVIPEKGNEGIYDDFDRKTLADYPQLQRQFPYTHKLSTQNLGMNEFKPGETYAICFRFEEENMPDVAFAMTIHSQQGTNEFGTLPLFFSDQTATIAKAPPTSAEQLRSELESALKARDRSTVLSLIKWQGLSPGMKTVVNDEVDDMLNHEIASVKLSPLPVWWKTNFVAKGIRYRPAIPLIGVVYVYYTERGARKSLAYGREGNAFYFSYNVQEIVEAPAAR